MYLAVGDYAKALECVNQAVTLAPNDAGYWDSRGEVYMAMQAYGEALFNFNHALSLSPQASFALANKAKALHALGRHDEAVAIEQQQNGNGEQ
jgi:tetratricopeptide (TPR) repeat protein